MPTSSRATRFSTTTFYLGNTHQRRPYDYWCRSLSRGEHLFTCCAKAHQADCGNGLPTTYAPFAARRLRGRRAEFSVRAGPAQLIGTSTTSSGCAARRIRVPDQWYGDYLAMVGAARIGERRLKELAAKFGKPTDSRFHPGMVRLLGAPDDPCV